MSPGIPPPRATRLDPYHPPVDRCPLDGLGGTRHPAPRPILGQREGVSDSQSRVGRAAELRSTGRSWRRSSRASRARSREATAPPRRPVPELHWRSPSGWIKYRRIPLAKSAQAVAMPSSTRTGSSRARSASTTATTPPSRRADGDAVEVRSAAARAFILLVPRQPPSVAVFGRRSLELQAETRAAVVTTRCLTAPWLHPRTHVDHRDSHVAPDTCSPARQAIRNIPSRSEFELSGPGHAPTSLLRSRP